MDFQLHENLANKAIVTKLPLSLVLLQDEVHFPWLIVVPQRAGVKKMMDLSAEDQQQLMKELHLAQTVLQEHFCPAHINVAAIGNKVPQLHIHVIARFIDDPAWPKTAWDHPTRTPYPPKEKQALLDALMGKFS